MNKNHKREAQQRRAIEREKKEKREKVGSFLKFWMPIIGVAVVTIVLVWAVATSADSYGISSSGSDADTTVTDTADTTESDVTETNSDETADETAGETATEEAASAGALNTDASLVAENGQTVNIDFKGYIDGEAFEGGDSNGAGYDLELGSNSFIDGFEEGIVGHNVGDTFTLDLKFPDDYWSEDYRGKAVTFDVTLNGIYQ